MLVSGLTNRGSAGFTSPTVEGDAGFLSDLRARRLLSVHVHPDPLLVTAQSPQTAVSQRRIRGLRLQAGRKWKSFYILPCYAAVTYLHVQIVAMGNRGRFTPHTSLRSRRLHQPRISTSGVGHSSETGHPGDNGFMMVHEGAREFPIKTK